MNHLHTTPTQPTKTLTIDADLQEAIDQTIACYEEQLAHIDSMTVAQYVASEDEMERLRHKIGCLVLADYRFRYV